MIVKQFSNGKLVTVKMVSLEEGLRLRTEGFIRGSKGDLVRFTKKESPMMKARQYSNRTYKRYIRMRFGKMPNSSKLALCSMGLPKIVRSDKYGTFSPAKSIRGEQLPKYNLKRAKGKSKYQRKLRLASEV